MNRFSEIGNQVVEFLDVLKAVNNEIWVCKVPCAAKTGVGE